MALAKTDNSITEINGKIGGDTWRHDNSGQHVYGSPRYVNSNPSPTQQKRRNAFRQCVNFWYDQVTATQKTMWLNYAALHPTTNRKGETIVLTAYQMFMHINIYRAYNDVALIATPPSD